MSIYYVLSFCVSSKVVPGDSVYNLHVLYHDIFISFSLTLVLPSLLLYVFYYFFLFCSVRCDIVIMYI